MIDCGLLITATIYSHCCVFMTLIIWFISVFCNVQNTHHQHTITKIKLKIQIYPTLSSWPQLHAPSMIWFGLKLIMDTYFTMHKKCSMYVTTVYPNLKKISEWCCLYFHLFVWTLNYHQSLCSVLKKKKPHFDFGWVLLRICGKLNIWKVVNEKCLIEEYK